MYYLFVFVLDEPAAFSITGIIPLIAGFIMAPLYPILNRWIPRRYLFTGGMVSMIIGYTMLALFSSNLPVVIVALIFFYVPAQFIQMTAILSLTDSIEYGQLKNGKRNEAVTLSVRPMLDKIGGAMSNGAVGAVALAAGMTGHATAADMTASNIATFKTFAFYVPLVFIILSLVVFWFKVKIDEKMHAQIVEELEAKLASGEIVDDEAQAVIKNSILPFPSLPIRPVRLNRKMRSVADGPVQFLRSAVMNIPMSVPAVGPEPAACRLSARSVYQLVSAGIRYGPWPCAACQRR